MHPLAPAQAASFWEHSLSAAARGERAVLGAWDGDILAGTVTLLLDCPPNQPHRAEIAKLMTRVSHRGRGVAASLMRAAEALAVERSRTLLVLDTAADGGAAGLYEGLGVPAHRSDSRLRAEASRRLSATLIYWKRIGAAAEAEDSSVRNRALDAS